jgi:hypothetical protein
MSTTRRPTTTKKTFAQKERYKLTRLESHPVIHEMFNEALAYTRNDEFWYAKFLLASRGKFPKNFFVRKNCVCFKNHKNQIFSQDLGATPLEVYEKFKEFLRLHGRFDSDKDILADELARQMAEPKKTVSRGVVDVEVYDYLCRVKEQVDLSQEKYLEYKRLVFLVVRLGGKKAVEFDGDQIVDIKGIYEDENGNYYVDPKYFEEKEKKTKKVQKKATGSTYKSKEEDFEEIVKELAKLRKDVPLDQILNMQKIATT